MWDDILRLEANISDTVQIDCLDPRAKGAVASNSSPTLTLIRDYCSQSFACLFLNHFCGDVW